MGLINIFNNIYESFMNILRNQARNFSKIKMADQVDEMIKSNAVAVFSKTYCPYCVKAKKVLEKYQLQSVKIVELDKDVDSAVGQVMQNHLKKLTGASSVPRVFIAGKCIGGGDETAALERSNKLRGMLEEAGALVK